MGTITFHQDWMTVAGDPIDETNYRRFIINVDGGESVDMNLPFKADGDYQYIIDPDTLPMGLGSHTIGIKLILRDGERSKWSRVQIQVSTASPVGPSNIVYVED